MWKQNLRVSKISKQRNDTFIGTNEPYLLVLIERTRILFIRAAPHSKLKKEAGFVVLGRLVTTPLSCSTWASNVIWHLLFRLTVLQLTRCSSCIAVRERPCWRDPIVRAQIFLLSHNAAQDVFPMGHCGSEDECWEYMMPVSCCAAEIYSEASNPAQFFSNCQSYIKLLKILLMHCLNKEHIYIH